MKPRWKRPRTTEVSQLRRVGIKVGVWRLFLWFPRMRQHLIIGLTFVPVAIFDRLSCSEVLIFPTTRNLCFPEDSSAQDSGRICLACIDEHSLVAHLVRPTTQDGSQYHHLSRTPISKSVLSSSRRCKIRRRGGTLGRRWGVY
jgi:hypothetical protein